MAVMKMDGSVNASKALEDLPIGSLARSEGFPATRSEFSERDSVGVPSMSRRQLFSSYVVPASVLAAAPAAFPVGEDPVMPLWRNLCDIWARCADLVDQQARLSDALPEHLRVPYITIGHSTEFDPENGQRFEKARRFYCDRSIEQDRDQLPAFLLQTDSLRKKRWAMYDDHKARLAAVQAEAKSARHALGLPTINEKLEAADEEAMKALVALIKHGLKTPTSIIACLYAFAHESNEDLTDWQFVVLRHMADPLVSQVPSELADAFNALWPFEETRCLNEASAGATA
jgi:hypothetical protein